MEDGGGPAEPPSGQTAPQQARRGAGRPSRPVNSYFLIAEGSSGSKPDKQCKKCPPGSKPALIKSATPDALYRHLMQQCKGMDASAKTQLRQAEEAYREKHSITSSAAPSGSKRRSDAGSSVAAPPSKRPKVQLSMANYGVGSAQTGFGGKQRQRWAGDGNVACR